MTQLFRWCSKSSPGKEYILVYTTDSHTHMLIKCDREDFSHITSKLGIVATLKDDVDISISVATKEDIHYIWTQLISYYSKLGMPLNMITKDLHSLHEEEA